MATDEDRISEINLAIAISEWHDGKLESGERCPDYWDDLDTSERLAHHLWSLGYRKETNNGGT